MDRRKFIKMSIPATAGAAASGRLFGEPASLKPSEIIATDKRDDLIKYRLSNAKINPEQWENLVNLSKLWADVCANEADSELFTANPQKYLETKGISGEQQVAINSELNALRVFADKDIARSVHEGDPDDFFRVLAEKNIITDINNSSLLREKLDAYFIRTFKILSSQDNESQLVAKDSLYALYSDLGLLDEDRNLKIVPGNQTVPVAAVAIVVIAVSVVAYATVGIAAGAGVLAAVAISIAAATAIVIGGGGGHVSVDHDREIMEEMRVAAQISSTLGNDKLTLSILKDIENTKEHISKKLDDILDSAVKHKLINFDGVDEIRVRASLHSLVNSHLLNIA